MAFINKLKKKKKIYCVVFSILVLFFSSEMALAIDYSNILKNLRNIIAPLTIAVLTFSYIAGIFLIFRALVLFKQLGSSQSKPGDFSGPFTYLLIGAVLLYIPSSIDVLTKSIFGPEVKSVINGNVLNYNAAGTASEKMLSYVDGGYGEWEDFVNTIILYVQFIGFISFLRGWLILAKAGQPGNQPGTVSKGIVHIIGGILAINFQSMMDILHNTILGN